MDACLARLDGLARDAAPRLRGLRGTGERVARLNEFLFGERGFCGNREQYDDPRNSFLNEVLERRTGLPITLALVYMEVGARLGLPVRGVGFPGHFLAKVEAEPEILVDPFFGRVLDEAECSKRLRAILGDAARLDPAVHLRAASAREILVRMLANLKLLWVRRGDHGRALACCDRILLLIPDAPWELRDRGLVYARLECHAAALADLRRFLDLAPEDDAALEIHARVVELTRQVRRLH